MNPITLPVSSLFTLLQTYSGPFNISMQTTGPAKVGKGILKMVGRENQNIRKITTGIYQLNFQDNPEVMIAAQNAGISLHSLGKGGWQEIIPGTPFVQHKDTKKLYLRVMPMSISRVAYQADGKFVGEDVKQLLPKAKEKNELCYFVYAVENIKWLEIDGQRYIIKE